MLLPPFFLFFSFGEGFDDHLFISVKGVFVLLIRLVPFPSMHVCLFIALNLTVCLNRLQDEVCLGCEIDHSSFHFVEILLVGILESADDRESICENNHIGLGLG